MRVPLGEYWRLLSRYLVSQRRWLFALAGVVFAGIAARLLGPWIAARFLDRATAADTATHRDLLVLAVLFGVVAVLDQALTVATTQLGAFVSWRATNRLRADVAEHCLRLDVDFHAMHGPGELIERIDGDIRALRNFFGEFVLNVLGNVLLIVGVLVVTVLVDWRIATVLAGFVVVAALVFSRLQGIAGPYWLLARRASAALYDDVEDRFGGLPDIRANGASGYVQGRFAVGLRELFLRRRTATTVSVTINSGSAMVMTIGGVAILAVSAGLYLSGSVPIGTVFVMASYTRIMSDPLRRIVAHLDDLQRAMASIVRVRELLDTEPAVRSGPGGMVDDGALPVRFRDVSFRYPAADRTTIRRTSFTVGPGEILGVMGRTGAGKSTLVRLLLRLYDPVSGTIELGGVDLRRLTLPELRRQVAVVSQEVQLFAATIRDNLTVFDNGTADQDLLTVLHDVGLADWLAAQPDGLDTRITTQGMSAGEAQLLGVARVLARNPGLVILDEPTARVDRVTEMRLEDAFTRLFASRTGIIVAHRVHTLARADTIMAIDDGRIVEYGPARELAADPASRYCRALAFDDIDAAAS